MQTLKRITLLIAGALCISAYASGPLWFPQPIIAPVAIAAPGDIELTFTIPAYLVADFKAAFLARCPNDQEKEDPANPGEMIPKYTDKQWFKEKMRAYAWKIYDQGNTLLAARTVVSDPNAIQ